MTSAYALCPVPTFLAEYESVSSDTGPTENFSEIAYGYGNLTPVMSGGFFYGYFSVNASSQYGLVTTNGQENLTQTIAAGPLHMDSQ